MQLCNRVGFKISLSLSRECAIFREKIKNCIFLALTWRDEIEITILVFRDENEITYCYSRVSRRDRDFRKSFLMVEREKMKLTLTRIPGIKNSRWALVQGGTLGSTRWDFLKFQVGICCSLLTMLTWTKILADMVMTDVSFFRLGTGTVLPSWLTWASSQIILQSNANIICAKFCLKLVRSTVLV